MKLAFLCLLLAGCSSLNVSGGITITYNQDAVTHTKSLHVQKTGDTK